MILWTYYGQNGVKYENVFLVLTDPAAFIVKAGSILIEFSPKLVHITRLAHDFHRVSETIRCNFSKVDSRKHQVVFQNLKKCIQILIYLLNLS